MDKTPAVLAAYQVENEKLREALAAVSDTARKPSDSPRPELSSSTEALEGRYLAQIKKSKTLTVQLESEKARAAKLQEQLRAATAALEKLQQQQEERQRREQRQRGQAASGKSQPPSLPAARQLPFLSPGEGDAEGADALLEDAEAATAKQLKERLARAYSQVRERDVQLREIKRENQKWKEIVAREVGKPADELSAWPSRHPAQKGGGSATATSTSTNININGNSGNAMDGLEGWKSRAEQIVLLQGKVTDLERVVAAYRSGEGPPTPKPCGKAASRTSAAEDGSRSGVASDASLPSRLHPQTARTADPLGKEEVAALVAQGGDDLESLLQLAHRTCPRDDVCNASGATSSPPHPPLLLSTAKQSGGRGGPASDAGSVRTGVSAAAKRDVNGDARDTISEIAGRRLKGLREVEAELARAQDALKEEKGKQAAWQARLAALQRDNTQLRSHVQVMLDKSSADDELVAAYKAELAETAATTRALQRELAEWQWEKEAEEAEGKQDTPTHSPHGVRAKANAPPDASLAALRKENASLKARLVDAERAAAAAASATTAASRGSATEATRATYRARVEEWAREVAESTSESAAASLPVAALLRAAHRHLLLVEDRLQQVEARSAAHVSAPQAVLMENASLKERVKSLTELLRKEAEVQALSL